VFEWRLARTLSTGLGWNLLRRDLILSGERACGYNT